jgi:membrane-associated phospholipid phosphatase
MSTTQPHVTHPGQERTSRSFARRHAAFVAGELAVLLTALALAVIVRRHPGPLPGDVGVALALQHLLLPHHWLASLVDGVSTINWPVPSAIVVAGVVGLLVTLRRWLAAGTALLTSALADASSYITNEIVRRPRPSDHGLHILHVIKTYFSFPSGHVVHAVAFFGFVLFLTWQTRRLAPLLWPVRAVLIALIVLMGPSRVLEGEHWPSDVLGGLLYGAFWLILGLHVYWWAEHRRLRYRASRDRQRATPVRE